MALNTARKGARLERKVADFYAKQGYRCMRSAASKGPFDLVAYNRVNVLFIQVKSNGWPGSAEIQRIQDEAVPIMAQKLVVRWDDYQSAPQVREII